METKDYNYVAALADQLRSQGKYSFTTDQLHQELQVTDNAIKKSLQRLKQKKEVAQVRRGFYVIVPPEFKSRGILPPMLFVRELMKYLKRDYYVSLLNAAAIHGAAHQQPQEFFIMTTKPVLLPIHTAKIKINFVYRKNWAKEDIIEKKTETGFINVSSPELTALDLVNYYDRSGGFNRVATILEELSESMDAAKLVDTAARYGVIAAIQRLGYLLDQVLGKTALTLPLQKHLSGIAHYAILLRPTQEIQITSPDNHWKVIPNVDIETDEL